MTRFAVGASQDPRENRLTEVTAAVLERVNGLPAVFVNHVIDAGLADAKRRRLDPAERTRRDQLRHSTNTPWRLVEIRTQVATAQGRFVDLELLLRPPLGSTLPALLLWVEVKHGADLHGDQLDAYLHDIALRPVGDATRIVALLAPRGWAPQDRAVPEAIVMVGWQDLASEVRKPTSIRASEKRPGYAASTSTT